MTIIVKVAVCGNETREFRTNNPYAEKPVFKLSKVKQHGNRGQALEYAKEVEAFHNNAD